MSEEDSLWRTRMFAIGPLILTCEPFFKLCHGIRIPIKDEFVEVLATYHLFSEQAEDEIRSSLCADERDWRHKWRFSGKIHLFRVSYPVLFFVRMATVTASGKLSFWNGWEQEEHESYRQRREDVVLSLNEAVTDCAVAESYEAYDVEFGTLVEAEIERELSGGICPTAPCPYRLIDQRLFYTDSLSIKLSETESECLAILLAPPRRVRFVQHKERLPNYSQCLSRIKKKLKSAGAPDYIIRPGHKGSGTDDGGEYIIGPQ